MAGPSALSEVFVLDDGRRPVDRARDLPAVRLPAAGAIRPSHRSRRSSSRATTARRTRSSDRPPDGVIPQEVWSELSGAEILRRQLAGELPAPPLHHLTGLRLKEFGEGRATFALAPRPSGSRARPAGSREA